MRQSTSHRYLERIERVVDALLSAPAADHSVESLAAVANMSAYHFHRVFRTVMGETVNATMRRVRLSLAADRLASGSEPIGRIAESSGYESPEAFARAFRGFTRTAPVEYRRRYSNAGRAVRQSPTVGTVSDGTIDIVDEPARRVLAMRHDGPIVSIPNSSRRCWRWLLRSALLPRVRERIGVAYLDRTETKGFRYYCAVVVDADDRVFPDVIALSLPGGCYARYRLSGPASLIAPTFYAMQREGLPCSGFEFDDGPEARPLLERYDDALSRADDGPITDLLLPVRPRTIR
jgi:AraC family transcriptional regulator